MFSAFNIVNDKLEQVFYDSISEERYLESPEIMLSEGDVLLVKDGAGYGKHAYVDFLNQPSTVNGSIAVITPNSLVDGKFLYYYFGTKSFDYQADLLLTGMGVPHLTQHFLKNVTFPLPPMPEQEKIAEYLDKECTYINSALFIKQNQLDLLKRQRQSLIYEYVTGKKRVPGYGEEA